MNQPLSPREIQAVQLLGGIAVAVFVGMRFVPPRYRQAVGFTLTVCYLGAFAAFVIYVLVR